MAIKIAIRREMSVSPGFAVWVEERGIPNNGKAIVHSTKTLCNYQTPGNPSNGGGGYEMKQKKKWEIKY